MIGLSRKTVETWRRCFVPFLTGAPLSSDLARLTDSRKATNGEEVLTFAISSNNEARNSVRNCATFNRFSEVLKAGP